MGHIRSLSPTTLGDVPLWALLTVAEATRGLGGLDPALTQSLQLLPAPASTPPMVTLEEARRAGLCGDCDVRYAAIRVAVASPKTTTLPTVGERALVEEVSARSVARLMGPAALLVCEESEKASSHTTDFYLPDKTQPQPPPTDPLPLAQGPALGPAPRPGPRVPPALRALPRGTPDPQRRRWCRPES